MPRFDVSVDAEPTNFPAPDAPFPEDIDRLILGDEKGVGPGTYAGDRRAGKYSIIDPEGWTPVKGYADAQWLFGIRPPMQQIPMYGEAMKPAINEVARAYPHALGLANQIYPSPDIYGLNVLGSTNYADRDVRLNPGFGEKKLLEKGQDTLVHELVHNAQFANQPTEKDYNRSTDSPWYMSYRTDPGELQARAVVKAYRERRNKALGLDKEKQSGSRR
jgi:hypothetical protein